MIHIGRQVPRIVLSRGFASLYRPNESLLVPWRLASFILHATALLCVADCRHTLIVESSLLPLYTSDDYEYFARSAQAAVALTVICLAVCVVGIASSRTLRLPGVNLLHCLCHTAAGISLIMIWYRTSHVHRLWHVFYVFSIIPAVAELIAVMFSLGRGGDLWK